MDSIRSSKRGIYSYLVSVRAFEIMGRIFEIATLWILTEYERATVTIAMMIDLNTLSSRVTALRRPVAVLVKRTLRLARIDTISPLKTPTM